MATDRSVIQIIVEAVLRGTGIRDVQKDLKELERQEKRNVASADAFTRAEKEQGEQIERNLDISRRWSEQMRLNLRTSEGWQRMLQQEAEAQRKLNDEQLTFFDRISEGNKIIGERNDQLTKLRRGFTHVGPQADPLLLDLAGQPMLPGFERRRQRDPLGRFLPGFPSGLLAAFGGGGEGISPRPGDMRLFGDLGRDADAAERRVSALARGIFNVRNQLGGAIPFLQRFRFAQESAFDPADLTRFDETMEIGFRRVARLLAVLTVFLPFLTVGFGALLGSVTALIGGVTALAGAFGTLIGLVATLPGLFAATAGAAGAFVAVLGPGIRQVSERFTEIIQLQDAARKRTTENAVALRDAEEALSDARLQSAEQVADIEERIREARQQSAEQIADQERDLSRLKVRNAEQEADAVRDLRRARKDAADDAREAEKRYQELVRQNRKDERELAQELSARRAQLGALRLAGADATTLGAAEAGVARIQQELTKEQTQNRKQEDAARKSSTQQARHNQEQIADAERRLFRTRRDNRQQEADAERRLLRTRRDSARQILDLEQQRQQVIAQGLRQERDAVQRVAEQRRKASGDIKDSLEGLSATQKQLVLQLVRIRETWLSLTAATRERGLQFIGRALGELEQKLPGIATGLNGIVDSLLQVGGEALERFTSPERWGRFNRILLDTRGNASQIARALVEVADAFLTLADAARPLTSRITRGVQTAAEEFNAAIQEQERTGGLDRFFAATDRVLTLTVQSLKNLGSALLDVLRIAEPFGEVLLKDFLRWTQGIEDWTSSPTGAKALESFFRDSLPIVEALADFVDELVQSLFRVGREIIRPDQVSGVSLLQEVIEDLTGVLPRFERFLIQSFRVNGPVVINFLKQFTHFMGVLVGPGGAVVQFLSILTLLLKALDFMPDSLEKLIFTYLVFHKAIVSVAASLAKLRVALLTTSGLSRQLAIGFGIAALIAFPGLVDTIVTVLHKFESAVRGAFKWLDSFLRLLGLGGHGGVAGAAATAVIWITEITAVLLIFNRALLFGAIKDLIFFYRLLRSSQAATLFAKVLESVLLLFDVWIKRFRLARAEAQKFATLNIASSFSSLANTIGLAVDALIRYIVQTRRAREANKALAISNAGVGFTNLFATGTGLAGLGPLIGRLAGGLGGLLGRLAAIIGPWKRFGLAVGGSIIVVNQLDKALNKLFDTDFFEVPRLEFSFKRIRANLHGLGIIAGDLIRGDWGKFWRDLNTKPDDLTAKASEQIGKPIAKGVFEGFEQGMEGFDIDVGKVIQTKLRQLGEIEATTENEMERATARRRTTILNNLDELLTEAQAKIDAFKSSASQLEFTIPAFLRARRTQEDVPAAREIERIRRQEVLRQRATTRRDADDELKETKRQAHEREQTLEVAQRRLSRLLRRVGRGPAFAGRGRVPGAIQPLTPEQQRVFNQQMAAVRAQERVVRDRRRELNEAEAAIREVSKRRKEVYRQVAQEERIERLEQQAVTQRKERENEVAAAERRVGAMVAAANRALDKHKISLAEWRRRIIGILIGAGATREEATAWLRAGELAGNDFGSGLIASLHQAFLDLPAAIKGEIQKARIAALVNVPAVIITDVRTIRAMVLTGRPPAPEGKPKFGHRSAAGGSVPGQAGAEVPILAHAGEWVLNRSQQLRMAMLAGADRSVLERALFHRMSFRPQFRFAMGGVVPAAAAADGGVQFLTPINIQTASPTVDIEYVARAFESRIAAAVE